MSHTSSTTKSIDVGGVFMMDLSINESESIGELADSIHFTDDDGNVSNDITRAKHNINGKTNPTYASNEDQLAFANHASIVDQRLATNATIAPDYLGSSLDRLASVINCDGHQRGSMDFIQQDDLTVVGRQQTSRFDYGLHSSLSSLSDESFVASCGTSLSASLIGASESENGDKGSTTTREDSGVLDMKDLDGQLNNSLENENTTHSNHNQKLDQEKPFLSNNMAATNLAKKSIIGNHNNYHDQHHQSEQQHANHIAKQHPHRSGEPTEGSGNNKKSSNSNNHHNSSHSKRTVSASLPIQVPVRQMRKGLNEMKLNLMKDASLAVDQQQLSFKASSSKKVVASSKVNRKGYQDRTIDDDELFLEQEYNENHHNHYPIEIDDEHVRADEDPMRLFASIQALARSLHGDAELIGSLPPKRMLESPIRSIALV